MSNKQSNIKFSVIIPTRERHDTLRWTLQTCVSQDYCNLEIIVSDNFSQDATRDVVDSFQDSRIRYFNSGKRLSMSHNWEFGLSHATGNYVTFVGDDDGLMPDGLEYARELINETKSEALICKKPLYYWPNHLIPEYRNILAFPLRDFVQKIDSRELLNRITSFEGLERAPLIYDGFIKKDVLDGIKNMSGQFFHSQIPDVYSAIAVLGTISDYYFSTKPFLIQGISGHSTGASYLVQGGTSKPAKQFYSEENIPFHPNLLSSPSPYILMAESLLQAREHVRTSSSYDFDVKVLVNNAMENAVEMSVQKYRSVVESVKFIGETYRIQDYVAKKIEQYPNRPSERQPFQKGYNFLKDMLSLNLNEDMVGDIYQASIVCDRIRNNISLGDHLKYATQYIFETIKRPGILAKLGNTFFSKNLNNSL